MRQARSPRRAQRFACRASLAAAVLGSLVLLAPDEARAESIIKNPGDHPDYSVELEPHLVLQYAGRYWGGEGWGPGIRVNIPIVENGFVSTINNNVAIGFGMDIAFGDNDCGWWWHRNRFDWRRDPRWSGVECSTTDFWFPAVMQWNFWLTDVISVFGEPGFAIAHHRWSYEWWCGAAGGPICEYDDSKTRVRPVFFGGARFMFSDSVGATVRIGYPYISGGINIML